MDRLIQIIESLRKTEHYECGDCFYSCPSHEDYCGQYDRNYCNCGLAENNTKVDEALRIIQEMK